jgi:hypothetical protein
VPVGNAEKMVEGIKMALEKPIPHEVLKKRANDFSIENSIEKYADLIEIN